MEIQTRNEGTFTVVTLSGEVDVHFSPQVRDRILKGLDDGRSVLVDLSGVSYIDSSGIASLVEGLQHAKSKSLAFGLAGVRDSALQVLKLTRLDKVFPMHDSVEDGLKAGG